MTSETTTKSASSGLLSLGRPSVQGLWVLLSAWTLITRQSSAFADDPGLGWHLAVAKLILSSFSVPRIDPFLHSSEQRAWVCDQWFSDLLMYGAYSLASWPGLYALLFAVFLGAYFLILYPSISRSTSTYLGSMIAVAIAFKLGQVHFIARPVVFNMPLFAYVYVSALRLKNSSNEEEARRQLRRSQYTLPLLFVLWANIHGSFALGLGLLGLLFTACLLEFLLKRSMTPLASKELLPGLAGLVALCGLATLLNPNTWVIHHNILNYTQNEYFMQLMSEWRGLDLSGFEGRCTVLCLAVLIISGITFRLRRLGWSLFEPLSVLAFAYLSWDAVRVLPFLGIVFSAPLAVSFREIARVCVSEAKGLRGRLGTLFGVLEVKESRSGLGRGEAIVVILLILGSGFFFRSIPFYVSEFGPRKTHFPYAAVEQLVQSASDKKALVIASHPNWGGFITLFGEGRLKPLIDDRNRMLGSDFYKEYLGTLNGSKDWQHYLLDLDAEYVLLSVKEPIVPQLRQSDGVELIHEDSVAVLFRVVRGTS